MCVKLANPTAIYAAHLNGPLELTGNGASVEYYDALNTTRS